MSLTAQPTSTLIETQFPIARLSAEAYRERMAVAGQTLTGLGKWWGRKPLVLVRAVLLGLLLPASDDPHQDMQTLLKLLTMDDAGVWRRKNKSIPGPVLLAELLRRPPSVQRTYLQTDAATGAVSLKPLARDEREALQRLVFEGLPYSERLKYCLRPEQLGGPTPEAWAEINAHLGTTATALPGLVAELGQRRWGHRPRVGDAFCGGGSIPFEAARLGCDAYGSDLNPVAALLTWAALHIVGGGPEVADRVQAAQQAVFDAVDAQVTAWGLEHNEQGWRADAYLYCSEARCPECGWLIPLAPAWVIAEKTNVIAELAPDPATRRFGIEVHEHVSAERLQRAKASGTVAASRLACPHCGQSTPIEMVRRDLRMWANDDLAPRPDDVYQERLYCIRWVETYYQRRRGGRVLAELTAAQARALPDLEALLASGELKEQTRRHYRAPDAADAAREARVLALLQERFADWQAQGYLPSRPIEPGDKTDEPIRTRGWTHWHHLFTPRQLLTAGLFSITLSHQDNPSLLLPLLGRLVNVNSKLCRWLSSQGGGIGGNKETYYNQALNTLYNWAGRAVTSLASAGIEFAPEANHEQVIECLAQDARSVQNDRDLWITDPPYADAVNYHELSEFFLAWYEQHLLRLFPDWYADSKRALAIRGSDPVAFRQGMVAAYRNLAAHMPDVGLQVVMFTHQDAAVWADLTTILWAAGLRVTAAWTIATETDSAFRQGNYVQGTVLLVCRKRAAAAAPVFEDQLVPEIEREVRRQLDSMRALDDASEPNFGDADYQLAAYAAALRVLTAQPIEDIDPLREISRVRPPGEESPVERLIKQGVRIACDHLAPRGLERELWRLLTPMERFYVKGLEVESHAEYRNGVYIELARGFGANDYADLLADDTANQTRLKTPGELGRRWLGGEGFGASLLRHVLYAVHLAETSEEPRQGLGYLRTERRDYWVERIRAIQLLSYLAALRRVSGMEQWHRAAESAEMLAALLRGDHT
jgi:adenine-specific DNA methylase